MEKKPSQTGRIMKTVFNPRVWMDYEQVKNSSNYLKNGISKLFRLKSDEKANESFDEAVIRLGLDEEKISSQQKSLFRLAILMVIVSIGVFIYAMTHLYSANFHVAGATFVIFCVVLSLAFRYHFWYYQLKQRRLGCSIKEWFIHGFLGVKK